MKRKILQKIADRIISKLEKTTDDELFNFYLELGVWYDDFCINTFEVYLD